MASYRSLLDSCVPSGHSASPHDQHRLLLQVATSVLEETPPAAPSLLRRLSSWSRERVRRGGDGESAAPWRAARNHVGTHNKVKTLRFTHLTGFPLRLLGRGMQSGTVAGWGAPREETLSEAPLLLTGH